MSPFGCYFIAFGTLVPPNDLALACHVAKNFFVDKLSVDPGRLAFRVSSEDKDLVELCASIRVELEVDGYDQKLYRHQFGVQGLAGRNINVALRVRGELRDVGNLIAIERDGRLIGAELAFGVNCIIARRDELAHPVDASSGALLRNYGFPQLIAADAAGSAVALALDGLRPVARGRGGNFRSFLRILADHEDDAEVWRHILSKVIEVELAVRRTISSHEPDFSDLSKRDALDLMFKNFPSPTASGG